MAKTRLFVALPVSGQFRDIAAALSRRGLDARWTHPGDLHITIRFLGDVDPERAASVTEALIRVRRPPFYIDIAGLDIFDNRRNAVLYARVESTRKLTALCGDVTDALVPLGFDFGTRPFIPHVTLARLGGQRGLETYIRRHAKAVTARWQAESFALMRSGPPNEKGIYYNILSEHPLLF